MKTIDTVTATDNTISIDDLSRVTGGVAPSTSCKDGGCIPSPFPRPLPFPGPDPMPLPLGDLLGTGGPRR